MLERSLERHVAELREAPLFRKVLDGTITRAEYCDLLQSLLTFHRSFERALGQAKHLPGFDVATFGREEVVLRDLRNLGGRLPIRAPAFLDRIERLLPSWSSPPSVAFVGALHVLERERLQFLEHVPLVARAIRVKVGPRVGLDYWLEHSSQASRRCHAISTWIDAHVRARDRAKEMAVGAVQTLRALVAIHGGGKDRPA